MPLLLSMRKQKISPITKSEQRSVASNGSSPRIVQYNNLMSEREVPPTDSLPLSKGPASVNDPRRFDFPLTCSLRNSGEGIHTCARVFWLNLADRDLIVNVRRHGRSIDEFRELGRRRLPATRSGQNASRSTKPALSTRVPLSTDADKTEGGDRGFFESFSRAMRSPSALFQSEEELPQS